MSSVTKRIGEVKQPRGGYINPSQFDVKMLNDSNILIPNENIPANLVGLVVDYMTRFSTGTDVNDAFSISLLGAQKAELYGVSNALAKSKDLVSHINSTDDTSIVNACQLVSFDMWLRAPAAALFSYKNGPEVLIPNEDTIHNIQIMIDRSVYFFDEYGPITQDGFTFEGGYTETVNSGDGDFLTFDTLWDFKVSNKKPTSKHTLQLLMYYIMGKHSKKKEFKNIAKLGIFNPRLNTIYTLDVTKIDPNIIKVIESDVICY